MDNVKRDGPSPEAIRRATLHVCEFLAEDNPGVAFVPADADDPDALLVFGREASADGGGADLKRGAPGRAPVRGRGDDDAQ